jgi:hypothetical protein
MHEAVRMAVVSMTAMAAVVMVELQGVPLSCLNMIKIYLD